MSAGVLLGVVILFGTFAPSTAVNWYNPKEEMNQCIAGRSCSCEVTGHWQVFDSYFKLKSVQKDLDDVSYWMRDLDLASVVQEIKFMSEKLEKFERDLEKTSVDEALKYYASLQRELAALAGKVDTVLRNGTTESEIISYGRRVTDASRTLSQSWLANPLATTDRLNEQIAELHGRLATCQEYTNGSYFRGDFLPMKPSPDNWCELYEPVKIGDSLTHASSRFAVGNWFKDPYPVNEKNITNVWARGYAAYNTYGAFAWAENYTEFVDQIFKNVFPKTFHNTLTYGIGYMMYNGSIYYHYGNELVKYTASNDAIHKVGLTPSATEYLRHSSTTRVDMKVDEYGLYAVYTDAANDEKLKITRFNPLTLEQIQTWNTNRHKSTVCATFMICGKLFTLDNCWSRLNQDPHHKQYIYDTLTGEEIYANWHVTAKFGQIWMIGYNPRERLLFAWDNGHLVTYPVIWRVKKTNQTA